MDTSAGSKEATAKESEAPAQRVSESPAQHADENSNSTDSEGHRAAPVKSNATAKSTNSSPPAAKPDDGSGNGVGGSGGDDDIASKSSARKTNVNDDDDDDDDGDDDGDGASSESDDGKQEPAAPHTPPSTATSASVTTNKQQKQSNTESTDANVATNVKSDKKAPNSASNSPAPATVAGDADTLLNTDSQSSVDKSPPPPPPASTVLHTATQPSNTVTTASTQQQTPPSTTTTAVSTTTTTNTTATQKPSNVTADIPDTILSPPKSETQTDETNTATSSSPASDAQLSPVGTNTAPATPTEEMPTKRGEVAIPPSAAPAPAPTAPKVSRTGGGGRSATSGGAGTRVVQPINVVANGTIPKSGKPLMSAMNKKLSKSSRPARPRKQKALVAMYESEISDNKIGIKLCIKKSDTSSGGGGGAAATTPANANTNATSSSSSATTATAATTAPSKQNRKRSRKSKARPRVDSDDSEYETKRKKDRAPNNNADKQKKVSFSGIAADAVREPVVQTEWGAKLPEDVLFNVFQIVIDREGCLPTLFRLGRVCSLWRRVSLRPTLWRTLDLSTWIKEKYRNECRLKWFIDNRCSACTDLNVSNWKVSDINCFLNKLAVGCPKLMGITLSGWKGFTSDHLSFLVENMKNLGRLDLSSINVEMNASKSAVGLQSLCNAVQTINGRLTHLYLAHNRLAGIPQIVNILSTYCPNLVLLDLSNVTTQATSHGILHIEKLQHGCSKLKVLRVTNSHVTLGTATMQEMMDSPGFPDLEELSVAALTDESRVIGDEHLQRILKSSSKLKLLDVRGCSRLTHESLIRLPAWDIKHLFLSGCSVTRDIGSGLELIASKWAHSLIELDLAWANVQQPLDNALRALAEKGSESPLAHLNLCGSSVSDDAVKEILANCAHMSSINLASCRGLPRGVKRLMQGPQEVRELREVLKVQMKVKLPSQLKQEEEDMEAAKRDSSGGGGGSGGGGVSQTN